MYLRVVSNHGTITEDLLLSCKILSGGCGICRHRSVIPLAVACNHKFLGHLLCCFSSAHTDTQEQISNTTPNLAADRPRWLRRTDRHGEHDGAQGHNGGKDKKIIECATMSSGVPQIRSHKPSNLQFKTKPIEAFEGAFIGASILRV